MISVYSRLFLSVSRYIVLELRYLYIYDLYLAGPGDAQKERNEPKAARQFLWLVSIAIGWPYALLILSTLGKWRLQNLLDDHGVKILKYVVKNCSSFFRHRLKEKAVQCDLQQIRISQILLFSISAKPP